MEIKKYQRKSEPIEAVQHTGDPRDSMAIVKWILSNGGVAQYAQHVVNAHLSIATATGSVWVSEGDWIIKTEDGHFDTVPQFYWNQVYEEVK